MAEPVKIKFDYQNPENVEAEVPESQKIREVIKEHSNTTDTQNDEVLQNDNVNSQNEGENSKNGESPKNGGNLKENPENGERIASQTEVSSVDEESLVMTRRRRVISGKRNGIHGEPVLLGDKLDDKKGKTKIPISKFRQTVERVKAERRGAKDKKEHESHIPVRRPSNPNSVKEHQLPPTAIKTETTITKTEVKKRPSEHIITRTVITQKTTEPEDEFDKIYAEIVTTPTEVVLDDSLLNPKVEDPEKLESRFEEIIHDYDEHKSEPIDVEVVRRSKIPSLKRRSQQEIELRAQEERTSKIIAARDKLRMRRNSLTKSETFEDELDKELKKPQNRFTGNNDVSNKKGHPITVTKQESKEEKISSKTPNSTTEVTKQFTKTVSTTSSKDKQDLGSSHVVETTTIQEVTTNENSDRKENKQQFITEENITNDFINIGIPVSNSYIHEFSENNESTKVLEVKTVLSYTSKNEDLSVKNTVSNEGKATHDTNSEWIELSRQTSRNINSESKHSERTDIDHQTSKSNDSETIFKSYENHTINNDNLSDAVIQKADAMVSKDNDKKENKQQFLTEESVVRDSIKIGFPVFDSYVHEISENNESTKTVEVKTVLSHISKNVQSNDTEERKYASENNSESVDISHHISRDIDRQIFKSNESNMTIKYSENHAIQDNKTIDSVKPKTKHDVSNETHVNDVVHLRNKTSKIESRELIETEANKRESINELTKKKSVLSKIAMFERNETEETLKTRAPRREIKPPNLIIKDLKRTDHVHMHTPLIVDEVFKPFEADIDLNTKETKQESLVEIGNEAAPIIKAERVTVESPESVHYTVESLVQEGKVFENIPAQFKTDSEYTVQKVKVATITDIEPSKKIELLTPRTPSRELHEYEFNKFTPKETKATTLNMTKELQAPVIIPGFKPVSELLRSFESMKKEIKNPPTRTLSKVEYTSKVTEVEPVKQSSIEVDSPVKITEIIQVRTNIASTSEISYYEPNNNETYDDFESINEYKSLDDVFSRESDYNRLRLRQEEDMRRAKSLAELDLGDAVKGKVNNILTRMTSVNSNEIERKDVINKKEMPRKRSVSEKIALFEGKLTPSRSESPAPLRIFKFERTHAETLRTEQKTEKIRTEYSKYTRDVQREKSVIQTTEKLVDAERSDKNGEAEIQKKIEDLSNAKLKYGKVENMALIELSNGMEMPALAVGTALLEPRLTFHVVTAAIDLGYRAIDTAYIYGNELQVGEAIRAKIADGTVKREELFVINKLWSTYHRTDLVEGACRASLKAMGLDYFDLYLIHNPMSFKEGGGPVPKIATVIQYSEHNYLEAWYGMEGVLAKGLVRAIGVSNFNSVQLQRVLDKGRIKPVVNQVECHPYLAQQRLDLFCSERNVTLSCFGVLGSKGTPLELTSGQPAIIDDALVQVMASGLGITPGQLLISYQLENGHGVVVKSSSAAHLWDNLQALTVHLTMGQVDALHALNRNKRIYTFKGMGDTHKNYPFNIAF